MSPLPVQAGRPACTGTLSLRTAAAAGRGFRRTTFPAQAAETLSRPQAMDALTFWLQTGQMLPSLTWA